MPLLHFYLMCRFANLCQSSNSFCGFIWESLHQSHAAAFWSIFGLRKQPKVWTGHYTRVKMQTSNVPIYLTFRHCRCKLAGGGFDRQVTRRPICARVPRRRPPPANPSPSLGHPMTCELPAGAAGLASVSSVCGLLPVSSRSHVAAEGRAGQRQQL